MEEIDNDDSAIGMEDMPMAIAAEGMEAQDRKAWGIPSSKMTTYLFTRVDYCMTRLMDCWIRELYWTNQMMSPSQMNQNGTT